MIQLTGLRPKSQKFTITKTVAVVSGDKKTANEFVSVKSEDGVLKSFHHDDFLEWKGVKVALPVELIVGSTIGVGSFRECFRLSIKTLPNHSFVGKRFKDDKLNSESHIYDLKTYVKAKDTLVLFRQKLNQNKDAVEVLLDKGKFQLNNRYCRSNAKVGFCRRFRFEA